MEMLIKQKSFNKQSLKKIFREFIEESRKNIDIKIKTISLILQSIKEENVNTDSKFKNSPYISPVYGIEKDEEEEFLNNLKELRDNLN